ncbi:MAG: TonB-dependent receptor [Gemmatimonadetes bacterium]|nr:TonB-dependent receptor [Gemmatimonadota bacterium]
MRSSLVVTLLALLPAPSAAQILTGRVVDAGSEQGIGQAAVHLLDPRGLDRAAVISDSTGAFQLVVPGPGRYSLRVEHIGYTPFTSDPLMLEAREIIETLVRLGRTAIPLDPLTVTARSTDLSRLARFRERMATHPSGKFVTREEIDRRPAAKVTDFFRTMAGVHVIPVKRAGNPDGMTTDLIMLRGAGYERAPAGADMSLAGLCSPVLLLDGVRIQQSAMFPIDDLLGAQMLEGIEVYTSAGDAPVELRGASACGVVGLWTQQGERTAGRSTWKRNAIGLASLGLILFLMR